MMRSSGSAASPANGIDSRTMEKTLARPSPPITIFEDVPASPPQGPETSASAEAEGLLSNARATQAAPPKQEGPTRKAPARHPSLSNNSEEMSKAAQEALGRWGIFGDVNSGDAAAVERFWTPLRITRLVLSVISGLMVVAGILFQTLEAIDTGSSEFFFLFKYCYFLGAAYPIFFGCYVLCTFTFRMAELHYFKEILAHYNNLIKAVWRVLATTLLLLWHYAVFDWLWCDGEEYYDELCNESDINNNTAFIISKSLSCYLVYQIASLIAAGTTKYISTHFYKSTHFKKLKVALEKEFQLQALSLQRQKHKAVPGASRSQAGPNPPFLGRKSRSPWGSFDDLKAPLPSIFRQGRPSISARSSTGGDGSGKMGRDGSHVIGGLVLDMPAGQREISASNNDAVEALKSLSVNLPAIRLPPKARSHMMSASADSSPGKYTEGEERQPGSGTWNFMENRNLEAGDSMMSASYSSSSMSQYLFTDEQLQQVGDIQMDMNYHVLQSVPLEMLENADPDDIEEMSDAEIERIRAAVVIKTYSSLINKHKHRTPEQVASQLTAVRKFGAALYKNICGPNHHRKYITVADMCAFFSDDNAGRKSARAAWSLFANDPRERVTKDQLIQKVEQLYVERSDIATSLINTESMMDSLESAMAGGLHFLCVAIYFLIWKVDVMQGFSAFSATVLAFSFIFGNSITQGFESLLFLFLQHPYDVGDNIIVDGNIYTVKTISLLSTFFEDVKGIHTTIANCSLFRKEVKNLSRTPSQCEFVTFKVDVGIATALIAALDERLTVLIKSHPSEYLKDSLDVKIAGFAEEGLKVKVFLTWQYTFSPDEWRRFRKARDAAMQTVSGIVAAAVKDGTADFSYRVKIAHDQERLPTPRMAADDEKSPFHVNRLTKST